MFPNTPEASLVGFSILWRPVWSIWVTLKTIYLFECLRGTLVVRKVLACFFFSSETGSYSRGHLGRDPFNQHSDRSDREKRTTSKGGPVFSKLFWLDRTDPLSFGPKFPEILVEWIAPLTFIVFYCIYTESFRRSFFFFNNNHNILILKCENTTFENRS